MSDADDDWYKESTRRGESFVLNMFWMRGSRVVRINEISARHVLCTGITRFVNLVRGVPVSLMKLNIRYRNEGGSKDSSTEWINTMFLHFVSSLFKERDCNNVIEKNSYILIMMKSNRIKHLYRKKMILLQYLKNRRVLPHRTSSNSFFNNFSRGRERLYWLLKEISSVTSSETLWIHLTSLGTTFEVDWSRKFLLPHA
jgi:hypothetical protein